MPRLLSIVALVCAAGLLLSCGSKQPEAGDEGRPFGTQIGYQAPAFDLPQIGGEGQLKLADLRGKVVLLSFWASWCGPCRVEVPALEQAWAAVKDKDVVIVGVSIDDTPADAQGFLRMFPVTYPMLLDVGGGQIGNDWQVMSLPTTIIIDKQGVVRRRHIGYTPQQLRDTLAEIDELLKEG